jgi:hypothetical protein
VSWPLEDPTQSIDFLPFERGELQQQLELVPPPFAVEHKAFGQLNYLQRLLAEAPDDSVCRSLVIERHYVDRDHMEDHSVFYSRNLGRYANYCRRVHFFCSAVKEVRERFDHISRLAGTARFEISSREFSDAQYLGFAVIRPLAGSCVGRTVLRSRLLHTTCAHEIKRKYSCHVSGVELTLEGLAFQQQDVGVAACATTAIWSALQKARDSEDFGAATPAQITMLAARNSLPFGRAMPNEGLSLDQMCQAIQAVGQSPSLMRVENATVGRGILHSCSRSGLAGILILDDPKGGPSHAVCLAGIEVDGVPGRLGSFVRDDAQEIAAAYVHDDRYGPFVHCKVLGAGEDSAALQLTIPAQPGYPERRQTWDLSHVLVPQHPKIRISISQLRAFAIEAVIDAQRISGVDLSKLTSAASGVGIRFESWLTRSHVYVQELLQKRTRTGELCGRKLAETVPLARYLGVIRLNPDYADEIDLLIDTTSTVLNTNCLAVVALSGEHDATPELVARLAKTYQCPPII